MQPVFFFSPLSSQRIGSQADPGRERQTAVRRTDGPPSSLTFLPFFLSRACCPPPLIHPNPQDKEGSQDPSEHLLLKS